jgi:hypothetical protein
VELYGLELQQEIDKDSAKYILHSRQASSASTSLPSPSSPTLSSKTPIPEKISASYAEIQELATEKCALAQQLIELLSKTRSRLDIDIVKVKMLQGESPDTPTVVSRSGARPLAATPTLENSGVISRNPALAISESLRNAFALTSAADSPSVTPPAPSGPATKSTSSLSFFHNSNNHPHLSRTPPQCHKFHQNNAVRNTDKTPLSITRNSDFSHDTCYSTEVTSFTSNSSSY